MRLPLVCFLTVFCVVTEAVADDWGFRQQVASYLDSHPYTADMLKGRDAEVIATIAIDRDGRLHVVLFVRQDIRSGSRSDGPFLRRGQRRVDRQEQDDETDESRRVRHVARDASKTTWSYCQSRSKNARALG